MTVNNITKILFSSFLLAGAGSASAAAFQLSEVSTSGLGRAYAGEAAIADNAAVVATNPALMGLLKKAEVSVGGIYVNPKIDIESQEKSFSHKKIIPNAVVPHFYITYPMNDKFALGGGINVNYGLATKFNRSYAAGFLGGKTDLKSVNLNFSGSYRATDNFMLGAGLNVVYAKAELERYVGGLVEKVKPLLTSLPANGSLNVAALAPVMAKISNQTVLSSLKGKSWGFGWNIGLVYEFNENNRIGLAYHSQVDLKFKGTYFNQLPLELSPVISLLKTLPNKIELPTPTAGKSQPGSLHLTLPAYLELSGYHKMTERFAMHYSYKYTQWSKFKELRAKASDGSTLFQKTEEFRDSSRIALGASYDINDDLTVRAGVAYDESAAQDYHSISIPDTDRIWYSLGATYRFTPNLSIDAGFAHLKGKKLSFTEKGAPFTSKAKAQLYGLTLNYRF